MPVAIFQNFGVWEILLLLLVLLLVFGPKRLPEMGRSMGRGMREFKDSLTGKGNDEDEEEQEPEQAAIVTTTTTVESRPAPAPAPAARRPSSPPAPASRRRFPCGFRVASIPAITPRWSSISTSFARG